MRKNTTAFNTRHLKRKFEKEVKEDEVIIISDKNVKEALKEENLSLEVQQHDTERKNIAKLKIALKSIVDCIREEMPSTKEENIKSNAYRMQDLQLAILCTEIFSMLLKELENYDMKSSNPTSVFSSFYTLSNILDDNIEYITEEEKVSIILYLIKQNINILKTYGDEALKEMHPIEKISLFKYQNDKYLEHNTANLRAIIQDKNFQDNFKSSIEIIEKKYLQNIDTYTLDDIEEIIKAFTTLQVSKSIVQSIHQILKKDLRDRKQKEIKPKVQMNKKTIEVLSSNKVKVNNITALKEKEEIRPIKMRPCYTARLQENEIDFTPIQRNIKPRKKNEIVKELSNYIDIENLSLKKEISIEDKFYILELLTDLNKDRSAINTLITNINLQISNSIGEKTLKQLRYLFANNIEKYYFYLQEKGYIELERYIKSVINNFNALACENNEELEELFIDEIKNALMSLENICPATYEYEFTTLEKQKKKKKY